MHKKGAEAEEYLELIFRMKEEGMEPRVKDIASRLGVAPASVSEMLRKLVRGGMVEAERYGKIRLTRKGEAGGRKILRRHRIIEGFLALIGVRKRVHEEACILEHAVSDEVERRMRKAVLDAGFVPLAALRAGEKGRVKHICAGAGECRRLAGMGLTEGATVMLIKAAPFRDPIRISVRGTTLSLGRAAAGKVFVEAIR
ncbi:MAG: metal-dependent transcriptional regulator [Candidatus Micrarchaeia archaeon]|jgi:DtxR family Mn-dependent transcriptional regulator